MSIDPDKVTAAIREAAEAEILPRYQSLAKHEVMEKNPGDLVTAADIETEKRLGAALMALLPGSLVVGEESVHHDASLMDRFAEAAPVWLIDPVDGTSNFVKGKLPFVVLVALVIEREACAGWIHYPVDGSTLTAERGGGAWRDGQRIQVAARKPLSEMTGQVNNRTFGDRFRDRTADRAKRFRELHNYRCAGHDFASLAQGHKDFSLFRRLWAWDHAAGALIHREAGGYSARVDGEPYLPSERVPGLLAAPNEDAWHEIHDYLTAD